MFAIPSIRDLFQYLIKGFALMLTSYLFSFITQWITGQILQVVLQVFVMAVALYFLDRGILPILQRMFSNLV